MSVDIGANAHLDGTSHGIGGFQLIGVSHQRSVGVLTTIPIDAVNEVIVLQRVGPTGVPLANVPTITISLADVLGLKVDAVIKFRPWTVCIENGDGTTSTKTAIFLSSDAY